MKPIMICWRSTPMGHDVTNNMLLFPSSLLDALQCDRRVDIKVVATQWMIKYRRQQIKGHTVYLEFESLCDWKQLRDSHHWLHCHLTSLISLCHYILTHSIRLTAAVTLQLASIPRTLLLSNPRPTSVRCVVKLQRSAALFYLTTGIDKIPDPRSLCERSETR